eukprot:TRINITY_DN12390_c0_g1_i1.p2 TRINITY_DN12390_c0_g1~~TRINITY_DN12390_c0_g1_i1.p2  ORF type:complete len:298 (+),score=32.31 TRINITY_DN12390_c0_g1_i1:188-1081(+)
MTYEQHNNRKQLSKSEMFSARKDKKCSKRWRDKGGRNGQLYLEVPHVKQLFSWDCGVACTLMVLKALKIDGGIGILQLQQQFCTRSVWTIDIAHMLRRYTVDVTFYTVTIGANPDFANENYYMPNISEDAQRVNRLFQQAAMVGLPIIKQSLSIRQIIDFITSKLYVIILLLDLRRFNNWLSAADSCFMSACCAKNGIGYQGHYIVLCGYDKHRQQFLLMDPGGRNGVQRQSVEAVDEARRGYGTDEDLLLIRMRTALQEGGKNSETQTAENSREKLLTPPSGGGGGSEEHQAMIRV